MAAVTVPEETSGFPHRGAPTQITRGLRRRATTLPRIRDGHLCGHAGVPPFDPSEIMDAKRRTLGAVTPDELRELLRQPEGERLEFKRSLPDAHQLVASVAAIANTQGGTPILG